MPAPPKPGALKVPKVEPCGDISRLLFDCGLKLGSGFIKKLEMLCQKESAVETHLLRLCNPAIQRLPIRPKRSLELAREAVTDPLTMLPNRKGINEHLIELLEPMERPGNESELALLFLDLDKFKDINDQHGHLAGDNVLKVVAERLRECLPRSAFAARWGGDEFIVVLPGLGRVEQVLGMPELTIKPDRARLQKAIASLGGEPAPAVAEASEHVIEVASSGRAGCRGCKEKIPKGELRFGEAVPNRFADTEEPTMRWYHLRCAAGKRPKLLGPVLAAYTGSVPDRAALEATLAEAAKPKKRKK